MFRRKKIQKSIFIEFFSFLLTAIIKDQKPISQFWVKCLISGVGERQGGWLCVDWRRYWITFQYKHQGQHFTQSYTSNIIGFWFLNKNNYFALLYIFSDIKYLPCWFLWKLITYSVFCPPWQELAKLGWLEMLSAD